jgi:hypothetical protein
MVYREVWLAPSDRMQELATKGEGDYPEPARSCSSTTPRRRATCSHRSTPWAPATCGTTSAAGSHPTRGINR